MSISDFFEKLANYADLFFWGVNQCLKIFFNDLKLFDVAIGWWSLLFLITALILSRIGGEE